MPVQSSLANSGRNPLLSVNLDRDVAPARDITRDLRDENVRPVSPQNKSYRRDAGEQFSKSDNRVADKDGARNERAANAEESSAEFNKMFGEAVRKLKQASESGDEENIAQGKAGVVKALKSAAQDSSSEGVDSGAVISTILNNIIAQQNLSGDTEIDTDNLIQQIIAGLRTSETGLPTAAAPTEIALGEASEGDAEQGALSEFFAMLFNQPVNYAELQKLAAQFSSQQFSSQFPQSGDQLDQVVDSGEVEATGLSTELGGGRGELSALKKLLASIAQASANGNVAADDGAALQEDVDNIAGTQPANFTAKPGDANSKVTDAFKKLIDEIIAIAQSQQGNSEAADVNVLAQKLGDKLAELQYSLPKPDAKLQLQKTAGELASVTNLVMNQAELAKAITAIRDIANQYAANPAKKQPSTEITSEALPAFPLIAANELVIDEASATAEDAVVGVKSNTETLIPSTVANANVNSENKLAPAVANPDKTLFTEHAPKMREQVVVKLQKAIEDKVESITVKLNPPELGKIDIKIEISGEGKTTLSFSSDNRNTLDLLQKGAKELERSLMDVGVKTDSSSLSFNLRGDGSGNEQAQKFAEQFRKFDSSRDFIDDEGAAEVNTITRRYIISDDAIDVVV